MHALSHDAFGLARLQPGSFRLVHHVLVLFTFRPLTGSFGGRVVRVGGHEEKEAVGEREVRGFSSPRETQPG